MSPEPLSTQAERRFLPPALLLLTAVLWSFGGVLVKSIDWSPLAIAGARSAIAIPVMLLFLGKPRLTFHRSSAAARRLMRPR